MLELMRRWLRIQRRMPASGLDQLARAASLTARQLGENGIPTGDPLAKGHGSFPSFILPSVGELSERFDSSSLKAEISFLYEEAGMTYVGGDAGYTGGPLGGPSGTGVGGLPSGTNPNPIHGTGVTSRPPPKIPLQSCSINADLGCGTPFTTVEGLPWRVRPKSARVAALQSASVQNSEKNCRLFAKIIKAECEIKEPIVTVFFPEPKNPLSKSVTYIINGANPQIFSNPPTVSIRDYFDDTKIAQVIPYKLMRPIRDFSLPGSDNVILTLKMPCPIPGTGGWDDAETYSDRCGFTYKCRASQPGGFGDTLTVTSHGRTCDQDDAFGVLRSKIADYLDRSHGLSGSLVRKVNPSFRAFGKMPLLNQVDGWVQGLFLDKYGFNLPTQVGICAPTSGTMMAIGLRAESPGAGLRNVFESQSPNQTTKTPAGEKQYGNYAVHIDYMAQEFGLLRDRGSGKLAVPDRFPKDAWLGAGHTNLQQVDSSKFTFEYRPDDPGGTVWRAMNAFWGYPTYGSRIFDYARAQLKNLILSQRGVVLGVYSPNYFAQLPSGGGWSPEVNGHALAVNGISGDSFVIYDPWQRIYHLRMAIQPFNGIQFGILMNVQGVRDGYVGQPFGGGPPCNDVSFLDGSTGRNCGTWAHFWSIFSSDRFPVNNYDEYRASFPSPFTYSASASKGDTNKCISFMTRGTIDIAGASYSFAYDDFRRVYKNRYPCTNLLKSGREPSLKDFFGTFQATCRDGIMTVTNNQCGLEVPKPVSCPVEHGAGVTLPDPEVVGYSKMYCKATCDYTFTFGGYTVNGNPYCACIIRDAYDSSANRGVIRDNLCVFAGCPSGKVKVPRDGSYSCLNVGQTCDMYNGKFLNSGHMTSSGAPVPHAREYKVGTSGYCGVTQCESGWKITGTGDAASCAPEISVDFRGGTDFPIFKTTVVAAGPLAVSFKYKVGPSATTNCGDSDGYSESLSLATAGAIQRDFSAVPANTDMQLCAFGLDKDGVSGNPKNYTWRTGDLSYLHLENLLVFTKQPTNQIYIAPSATSTWPGTTFHVEYRLPTEDEISNLDSLGFSNFYYTLRWQKDGMDIDPEVFFAPDREATTNNSSIVAGGVNLGPWNDIEYRPPGYTANKNDFAIGYLTDAKLAGSYRVVLALEGEYWKDGNYIGQIGREIASNPVNIVVRPNPCNIGYSFANFSASDSSATSTSGFAGDYTMKCNIDGTFQLSQWVNGMTGRRITRTARGTFSPNPFTLSGALRYPGLIQFTGKWYDSFGYPTGENFSMYSSYRYQW